MIRLMEQGDIEKILTAFSAQNWVKPRQVIENYFHEQTRGERFVFVAELNQQIAGYATLVKKIKNGPFKGTTYPEITDFNVFIPFQKRGIGTKILTACENKAFEFSDHVTLGVGLHQGYGSAQRLYVKRGYVPDGSGVWFENQPCPPYTTCENNDELVLYLAKAK